MANAVSVVADGKANEVKTKEEAFSMPIGEFLDSTPPEVEWLVEGLFAKETIGFIAGEPKVGKSWVGLHLALALTSGERFLGHFNVPAKAKTLYLQVEDSRGRVHRRVHAMTKATPALVPDREYLRVATRKDFLVDKEESRKQLDSDLKEFKPEVIIVDVFNNTHSGQDSDQSQMTEVMRHYEEFRQNHKCAIILVHHFRKSGAHTSHRGNQMMRGSTVLGGYSENSLYLFPSGNYVWISPESKDGEVNPFHMEFQATEDGGIALGYREDVKKSREEAFKAGILSAIETQYEKDGLAGTVVPRVAEGSGYSQNTVKKYADHLVKEGSIRTDSVKEKGRKAAMCYVPLEINEKKEVEGDEAHA